MLKNNNGKVVFNSGFLLLADHYNFLPRACRPRRARTKGKVERMVKYLKENFFVRYRRFDSFTHVNQQLEQWIADVADKRELRQFKETPEQRFSLEQEKLSSREREIDHLQAQLDKLRRMNFGSRSEKVSRRIAQMEADLNRLQQESDTLTSRVDDSAVQRPLRQTRPRKPLPESLPRDEKRLLPMEPCCPECGGSLSYLGEDAAEQLELMRSAFRVIRTVREKHACRRCDRIVQAPAPSRPIERGIAGPGADLKVCRAHTAVSPVGDLWPPGCSVESFCTVGLGGCMLSSAGTAG